MVDVEYRIKEYQDFDLENIVSLDEIHNFLRLPDVDPELEILRESAIREAERYMNRPITKQAGVIFANKHEFKMPYLPVMGSVAIQDMKNSNGVVTEYTISDFDYRIAIDKTVRLPVTINLVWLSDNAEQPVSLKIALLKMIASHYEMREDAVIAASVSPIPNTSKRILDLYRVGGGSGRL